MGRVRQAAKAAAAVPGTPGFLVDGFQVPAAAAAKCRSWFVSHYSAAATAGLHKGWAAGLVYCTPVTAALLTALVKLPACRIRHLPPRVPTVVQGVTVTALDEPESPTPGVTPAHSRRREDGAT